MLASNAALASALPDLIRSGAPQHLEVLAECQQTVCHVSATSSHDVRSIYAGKLVSHAPTSHAAHGHLSISDFNLVDHMGQPASSDDVLGEFVLFYFGAATNPATNEAMGKLSETVRQIGRPVCPDLESDVYVGV